MGSWLISGEFWEGGVIRKGLSMSIETTDTPAEREGVTLAEFEAMLRSLEEQRSTLAQTVEVMRRLDLRVIDTGYDGMGRRGLEQLIEFTGRAITKARRIEAKAAAQR